MNVAFCLPQFSEKTLRLQPWVTVHRISKGLVSDGHEVHIVTDMVGLTKMDGISIHMVDSLRGTNSSKICNLLQSIKPDSVVVSVTPLSLITASWYRKLSQFRAYAYLSYPFYKPTQIIKAFPYLSWRERWEYGRHIFVPRSFWGEKLACLFDGVICQSRRTSQKITVQTQSRIPVYNIPPGIDKNFWIPDANFKHTASDTVLLYAGAVSRIRGLFLLLDAIALIRESQIQLVILARSADEKTVKEIESAIAQRDIKNRVLIRGGWLKPDEIRRKIQSATAVILPFILVPSEIPISVMESIACGTPVIVSDLDGLPDAVGNAGIVVPNGNVGSVASAILKIHHRRGYVDDLNAACIIKRENMLSWDSVSNHWKKTLAG